MSNQKFLRLIALVFVVGLVVAACGGGDDSGNVDANDDNQDQSDEPDEETTTTTEDTTTTTEVADDRDDAIGDFGDDIEDDLGDMSTGTSYGEYVSVSDDSGTISVDVPTAWSDVDGSEGLFGPEGIAGEHSGPERA